jgi:hypothetical protein
METFFVKNLSDIEVNQHYWVNILNRFAVLENPEEIAESSEIDINDACEIIFDNVKIPSERSYDVT